MITAPGASSCTHLTDTCQRSSCGPIRVILPLVTGSFCIKPPSTLAKSARYIFCAIFDPVSAFHLLHRENVRLIKHFLGGEFGRFRRGEAAFFKAGPDHGERTILLGVIL